MLHFKTNIFNAPELPEAPSLDPSPEGSPGPQQRAFEEGPVPLTRWRECALTAFSPRFVISTGVSSCEHCSAQCPRPTSKGPATPLHLILHVYIVLEYSVSRPDSPYILKLSHICNNRVIMIMWSIHSNFLSNCTLTRTRTRELCTRTQSFVLVLNSVQFNSIFSSNEQEYWVYSDIHSLIV